MQILQASNPGPQTLLGTTVEAPKYYENGPGSPQTLPWWPGNP